MKTIDEVLSAPPRAAMVPEFVHARATALAGGVPSEREPGELAAGIIDSLGLDRLPRSGALEHLGRVEAGGCVVEKLVFEAVSGLPVPALLYLPSGPGPHPAVVHPPGHWMEDAKLAAPIQLLNQRLARSGIAVLCYDTLGQGERRIGWHQHGQLAPLLVGITSLGIMVAESHAAVDLLAGRSDIDAGRIGMIGASGGAYSSIYASALDTRVHTTIIACIVNTHAGQISDAAFGTGWDSWVDLCNQVPKICQVGTLGDILGSIAPRNLLVANAEDDPPFPLSGSRAVAERVRSRYRQQGSPGGFTYAEVPGTHGWQPATRTVATRYLLDNLRGSGRGSGSSSGRSGGGDAGDEARPWFEPQWPVPHNKATARDPQTRTPRRSEGTCLTAPTDSNGPVVALAVDRARLLRQARPPLTPDRLAAALGPFPVPTPLDVSVSNHLSLADYHAQRLELTTEPGIRIDAVMTLPVDWSDELAPVLVVLDPGGKAQAVRGEGAVRARGSGWVVCAPDLRGTGESAVSEFEVASAAWMLDRDLLNQRVWDVVRTIDFLSERYSSAQQFDKGRIAVWGEGPFGLVALLAAAVDPRIAAVGSSGPTTLEEMLTLHSRITPMVYRHHLLAALDIPDLVALIRPRTAVIGPLPELLDTLGWTAAPQQEQPQQEQPQHEQAQQE